MPLTAIIAHFFCVSSYGRGTACHMASMDVGSQWSVLCCRRLLASLLTSLLGSGWRATWLLLLAAEAAP